MLEWLKTILGEQYSEDLDKQISAEIGKGFVSRADFNTKSNALKAAEDALKGFEGVDVAALKQQIAQLQASLKEQADGYAFDNALDGAIRDAGGRNVRAIRALLDLDALRGSKEQAADIQAALKGLAGSDGYLFSKQIQNVSGMSTGGEHGQGGRAETDGVETAFYRLNPGLKT